MHTFPHSSNPILCPFWSRSSTPVLFHIYTYKRSLPVLQWQCLVWWYNLVHGIVINTPNNNIPASPRHPHGRLILARLTHTHLCEEVGARYDHGDCTVPQAWHDATRISRIQVKYTRIRRSEVICRQGNFIFPNVDNGKAGEMVVWYRVWRYSIV
jgi:hypothetical protein